VSAVVLRHRAPARAERFTTQRQRGFRDRLAREKLEWVTTIRAREFARTPGGLFNDGTLIATALRDLVVSVTAERGE
jgi:hypothetical protein